MASEPKCECGRLQSECLYAVQRSSLTRWSHYRCPTCLREWTIPEVVEDLADPVTSDEVIQVHEALAKPDLTMGELTK
jgi:hypothetical protein